MSAEKKYWHCITCGNVSDTGGLYCSSCRTKGKGDATPKMPTPAEPKPFLHKETGEPPPGPPPKKHRPCLSCGMINNTEGLYCSSCHEKMEKMKEETVEKKPEPGPIKIIGKVDAPLGLKVPLISTPPLSPPKVKKQAPRKHVVLVVDDEPHIVAILKTRLEANEYSVSAAADGMEAFNKMKNEKPDLVILDVLMKDLTGYELIAKLRAEAPECLSIPLILISARPDMKFFFDSWDYYRFFTKPFDAAEMMAAIEQVLGKPE